MSLLLAVVLVWCLLSAAMAFGLGPLMHKAAVMAEARDPARPSSGDRAAA